MDENNLWLTDVLTELSKIMGVELDITRPNDVAEFLMPIKDIEDETRICLFDLLNYLGGPGRNLISMAISMHMPYFAQKAKLNNKSKALARLELDLLDCKDEEIRYYMQHNKFEEMDTTYCPTAVRKEYYAPVPTTLLGRDISDYLTDPENPVVAYVIKLFKDKRISNVEFLGTDLSPWTIMGENPDTPRLD